MRLAFFSIILNSHQANVADALWRLTGGSYRFVELCHLGDATSRKGDTRSYDDCPYLVCAWRGGEEAAEAMRLAREAECCVFSGVEALPYAKERMRLGRLSFDMSERWLKRGLANALSPAIRRWLAAYWLGLWNKKPIYKLCCSAFAAADQRRLGTYRSRCYRWGYFTQTGGGGFLAAEGKSVEMPVAGKSVETPSQGVSTPNACTPLMWCARHLALKHPELPLLMAAQLKAKGRAFTLDMYGEGECRQAAERLCARLGLADRVRFYGNMPNPELLAAMHRHRIFLFTSDRNEGWGAVANESMAAGCALVASDRIGAAPWLVDCGQTGLTFPAPSTRSTINNPDRHALAALTEGVEWLLAHPEATRRMGLAAQAKMQQQWSPDVAASRLLALTDALACGADTPFEDGGPCSRA